jgi:hypothetical protein
MFSLSLQVEKTLQLNTSRCKLVKFPSLLAAAHVMCEGSDKRIILRPPK